MLSAFKANALHELKPRDKSKIESLLADGDRLLVGLSTGALRFYQINTAPLIDSSARSDDGSAAHVPKKSKAIELLREEDKFSRRPVQQLGIVKGTDCLVSLTDGYVSLHSFKSAALIERLEKTKGATAFSLHSAVIAETDGTGSSRVSRLAVATKRKVLVWSWKDGERLPENFEHVLEASVKALEWASNFKLVVGMDPGFSFLDVETGQITTVNKTNARNGSDLRSANEAELAGVRFGAVSSSGMGYMGMGSWVPKPLIRRLANGQILLAKDVNTLFVDSEGNPLDKRQIPWNNAPEAVEFAAPYLLALQPPDKGSVHIRNPDTLSNLQSIAAPGANIVYVPEAESSQAQFEHGFFLASDRTIWRVKAEPYDGQIQQLVDAQRFDEAISLLSLLDDDVIQNREASKREATLRKAALLFKQQKYRPALDLYTDAEAPPDRVVSLYPLEIAGKLASRPEAEAPVEDESEQSTADAKIGSPPKTQVAPTKGLLGRLTGAAGADDTADTASIKSIARTDTATSRKTAVNKASQPGSRPLEGDDLKIAVRCLCSFLAQCRVQIQKYLNVDGTLKSSVEQEGKPPFWNLLLESDDASAEGDWQTALLRSAQLVDTTLFRAYTLAMPSLAGPLFRLDNFCDPEVVQANLYETQRYGELMDFLYGKKLHRQALEMLAKFGKGEAQGELPQGLDGPEKTIAYLKQLPPDLTDMILEFARWPLETDPDKGMEIFLADTANATGLPRGRVLDFLGSFDQGLRLQYLEHCVHELGDESAALHQQLIDAYIEGLRAGADSILEKLEHLLRSSRHYNKAKTLRQLPNDDARFYESRAIVLGAMGSHKQALTIYVYQMHDYSSAEDYCNKAFLAMQVETQNCLLDGSTPHNKPPVFTRVDSAPSEDAVRDAPNVFAILLSLYLSPPPGQEKLWPQALELLARHGARLPAGSTLDLMPPDLSVSELQSYFMGRLRTGTSLLRQQKMVASLESVRRSTAERHLMIGTDEDAERGVIAGRNRRVKIAEDAHCKVCHRRFGASAVRVYPDGEVVHYGCVGRRPGEGTMRKTSQGIGRAWG